MGKLIIHAPNVYTGGGKILLQSLLLSLPQNRSGLLILDKRLTAPAVPASYQVSTFPPHGLGRLQAEYFLKYQANPDDEILCFNGFPPLFKIKGRVSLFLQCRNLLNTLPLKTYGFKLGSKIGLQRLWLNRFITHAKQLIVQTPSMLQDCQQQFGDKVQYQQLCLFQGFDVQEKNAPKQYDFLYVANGDIHKNHKKLFAAWALLANENIKPRLAVTLDRVRDKKLIARLEQLNQDDKTEIINLGFLPHHQLVPIYQQSRALINPSFSESLGLPLLEAKQFQLAILAPEMDYVRDIVEPIATFDPHSALSIARAVKRYLHCKNLDIAMLTGEAFINHIVIGERCV